MHPKITLKLILPLCALISFAACGDDPPPEPEDPPPAAGPQIRFVSAAADTKKVRADCTSGGEKFSDRDVQAVLPIAAAEKCTVTAYLKKGRRSATVTDVEAGIYTCFSGDDDTCTRK